MLLFLTVIYFLTFFCVKNLKKEREIRYFMFPRLKLTKRGVVFYSKRTHRIRFCNYKNFLLNNVLYLKTDFNLVAISNIKDVKIYNEFLYFTGCGKVEIKFDCNKIFRYFFIDIKSKQFDLNSIQQQSINAILI